MPGTTRIYSCVTGRLDEVGGVIRWNITVFKLLTTPTRLVLETDRNARPCCRSASRAIHVKILEQQRTVRVQYRFKRLPRIWYIVYVVPSPRPHRCVLNDEAV
eukprot:SAG31_NODE_2348_length_5895_cov_69.747930_6_plen_103_part_00